jgi:hypothetical protein
MFKHGFFYGAFIGLPLELHGRLLSVRSVQTCLFFSSCISLSVMVIFVVQVYHLIDVHQQQLFVPK